MGDIKKAGTIISFAKEGCEQIIGALDAGRLIA